MRILLVILLLCCVTPAGAQVDSRILSYAEPLDAYAWCNVGIDYARERRFPESIAAFLNCLRYEKDPHGVAGEALDRILKYYELHPGQADCKEVVEQALSLYKRNHP